MATAAPARPQAAPSQNGGFWIRFVAAVIDGIVLTIVNTIVGILFGFNGPEILAHFLTSLHEVS